MSATPVDHSPAPPAPPAYFGARRALRVGMPLIALAFLIGAVGTVPTTTALERLTARDLVAALVLGVVAAVASAGRWCVVARGLGVELELRRAVGEVYRSTLLNAVLPAGVLGDVHRALSQGPTVGSRGVIAVALERGVGQAVIATGALIIAAPALWTTVVVHLPPAAVAISTSAMSVGIVVALAVLRRRPGLRASVSRATTHVRAGVLRPRPAVALVGCSLIALVSYLGLFVLASRAVGVDAPLLDLLPIFALCLLATAIPLNVGGWGPREIGSTAAFAAAGIEPAHGLAVAVLYGLLSLVAALPGAVLLLLPRPDRRSCSQTPSASSGDGEPLRSGPGRATPTSSAHAAG